MMKKMIRMILLLSGSFLAQASHVFIDGAAGGGDFEAQTAVGPISQPSICLLSPA